MKLYLAVIAILVGLALVLAIGGRRLEDENKRLRAQVAEKTPGVLINTEVPITFPSPPLYLTFPEDIPLGEAKDHLVPPVGEIGCWMQPRGHFVCVDDQGKPWPKRELQ